MWKWQGSQYASFTQRSEYVRICLDRALNIFWVLNMPGFWIWQGPEYARNTQGSKYPTVWLNMAEYVVIMPEYAWIYDNKQDFEYVPYND